MQGDCISAELELLAQTAVTQHLSNPTGYGRIVRDIDGSVKAIVEEKDANADECLINEIYTGICLGPASAFGQWLPQLKSNNAQAEYYLTEIIRISLKLQGLGRCGNVGRSDAFFVGIRARGIKRWKG